MDLIISGTRGEDCDFSYDLLRSLPAGALCEDLPAGSPDLKGRAAFLSALMPDDLREGAEWLTAEPAEGPPRTLPLEEVVYSALIVFESGRGPLPPSEGGPFRLIVPAPDGGEPRLDVPGVLRIVLSAKKPEDA